MARGAIAIVLSLLALGAHGRAQGQAPSLRVHIVDDGDLGPLRDRLRGQLSDVDLSLSVGPDAGASHDVLLRFEGMDSLDGPTPQLTVLVTVPAEGATLRQRLRPMGRGGARSALLEQAAMFVRATLLALAEGGTLGVEAADPPEPDPVTEVDPPAQSVQPAIAVGVWGAIDGQTAFGQRGLELAFDLELDVVRLGARLAFGLPSESEDDRARLHLWHHGADAYVSLEGEPVEGVHLGAGASLGVALVHRSTEPLQPGIASTPPAWTASFRLGPRLSARWRPRGSRLELELAFALDIVPSPVVFAYAPDGAARSLWPAQPRLGLALRMLP